VTGTARRQVLLVRAAAIFVLALCFPTVLQTLSDFVRVVAQIADHPTAASGGFLDDFFTELDPVWLRRMLLHRSAEILGFIAGVVVLRMPARAALRFVRLSVIGIPP
jgi:hypothetical protein